MANKTFVLAIAVLLHVAISNVSSQSPIYYGYKYGNGDRYLADVNDDENVNCSLTNPCSAYSPYKICLPVYDGYMEGICCKDIIRSTPDAPVLSFVYYGTNGNDNELISLRYDIPNDPLQPCKGRGDTTSCKSGYFCLNSNDENSHFCASKVY